MSDRMDLSERSFHVDMCPDCGAVPFQHMMDPPWFCDHPLDCYVPVEVVPVSGVVSDRVEYAKGYARRFENERDEAVRERDAARREVVRLEEENNQLADRIIHLSEELNTLRLDRSR